jgi:hypothetical protein
MTPEQVANEQAADLARLEAGEMSEAEATARAAVWSQAAEYQMRQAEALRKFHRLKKAKAIGLRLVSHKRD